MCAFSCATLHYAYAELGIEAHPRAVDLLVADRRTDKHTIYGRPDPYWKGSTFHGHCSGCPAASGSSTRPSSSTRRSADTSSARSAADSPRAWEHPSSTGGSRGKLVPGSSIGVQRGELMLLYIAVGHEFDDVVMSGPPFRDGLAEVQRSGRNLAAQAINLLRRPEVIDRARLAPHATVRALLDLLADADADVDADADYDSDGNLRFIVSGDPDRRPRQLDGLELPAPGGGRHRGRQPAPVDRPRRRGPLAWFRQDR